MIPVVNADGRWHFFNDPNTSSSGRSLRVPRDDDRDGLVDEDFPDDLDGDGNICQMRKRDPFGPWKTDPEDPRLMVRVKPGEKGEWTILGDEGLDNDGDGKVNEDSEGYLDGNRNWGWGWAPPYVQEGAGNFPFSAAPTRAIAAYIMARPNIIATYALHNSGGMYLRGPSTKADEPMNPQDIAAYDILGKNAEKIVPGYRYLVGWKDLYSTYGDFDSFTYFHAGAYSFVAELFQTSAETYREPDPTKPAPSDEDDEMSFRSNPERERERLQFSDHVVEGELFKPWAPFKHPQYGDIEIGGWVKMSSRLPHPFMLADLVHRNAAAVLYRGRRDAPDRPGGPEHREAGRRPVQGPRPARQQRWPADAHLPDRSEAHRGPRHARGAGRLGEGRGRRQADRPLPRAGRVQGQEARGPDGARARLRQGRVPVPALGHGRRHLRVYLAQGRSRLEDDHAAVDRADAGATIAMSRKTTGASADGRPAPASVQTHRDP